jgi:uncharacterized protein
MYQPQIPSVYNQPTVEVQEEIQRGFLIRVYAWMTLGLFITAAAAFVTLAIPTLLKAIVTTPFLFFGLMIGELALVVIISRVAAKLDPWIAGLLFAGYAALNGVTLSFLVLVYTQTSILLTFGITACTFGIMSLFGYTTQRDLTKLGSLLIMALFGLILASLANLLFQNSGLYWIISYVGVLIFVGLVAYDTQKLKRMSLAIGADGQMLQRASILGALTLYLDFINLFLLLLRILGRRK